MNGEMLQLCRIVIAAKKALKENTDIVFEPIKYENSIKFSFIQKNSLFQKGENTANNVKEWFTACKDKGLTDIKLLAPVNVKDRSILGFSNTNQSCILCFYNKNVTFFTAQWSFDNINRQWNTHYTERPWENPPEEKPVFCDNSAQFKLILEQIRDLAEKIDCDNFVKIFQKSINILTGEEKTDNSELPYTLLPEEKIKLFKAAEISDVFGAMGSWNDSPPYMAQEKGLEKEYETLSDQLLKQIRSAILYSVNEW